MLDHSESRTTGTQPALKPASPALQFILGLAMIAGLLVAGVAVGQQESRKLKNAAVTAPPTAEAASPASGAATASAPAAASEPVAVAASESQDIRSQLGELTAQVKKLHGMVDNLPKPEPAPDLRPIEAKLDDLAQSVAAALPLVARLDKLGARIGDVDKQLQSIEAEVAALKNHNPGK
jgi:hypothetical protein